MRTFEEVVNYMHPHVIWCGTYWGWQTQSVWKEVCEAVHKYMQDEMESY